MKIIIISLCQILWLMNSVFAVTPDIIMENGTPFVIKELFIDPASDPDRESANLLSDVLPQDELVELTLEEKPRFELWCIRVIDVNDNEYIWKDVFLFRHFHFILRYNSEKGCWLEAY